MQAVVHELLPLVPFSRRDKALRYKHLFGQYTCLRSWQLLHELLTEHAFLPADFPLADLTYTEDEYGKPWLSVSGQQSSVSGQQAAICFSLSHTKNAIAVALDRQPVGIDVETIVSADRISDPHFLSRTMSAQEQQLIRAAANPCLQFTELWTKKEALVKAIGTGINLDTLPDLLTAVSLYTLRSGHAENYAYTVAWKE